MIDVIEYNRTECSLWSRIFIITHEEHNRTTKSNEFFLQLNHETPILEIYRNNTV